MSYQSKQWLDSPAISCIRVSCGLLIFLFAMACSAAPVLVQDNEWRQLVDTANLSWNEVATVCPEGGGLCNGSLGAVSFDGWTWATAAEVATLFTILNPGFPGGFTSFSDSPDSTWAPKIFNGLTCAGCIGAFTSFFEGFNWLDGFTATTDELVPDRAWDAVIIDQLPTQSFDSMITATSTSKHINFSDFGHWLYRPATVVPVPLPAAMLFVGTMILFRLRTSH